MAKKKKEEEAKEQPVVKPNPVLCLAKRFFSLEDEFFKTIVSRILNHSIIWIYLTYWLAYMGKEEIAENLSKAIVTTIISVILTYSVKALLENMSKHNHWPDKTVDRIIQEVKEETTTNANNDINTTSEYEYTENMEVNDVQFNPEIYDGK